MSETPPLILTDDDVLRLLSPTEAVSIMERVFLARLQGRYAGVPRFDLPFAEGKIVFTAGAVRGDVGFRAYLGGNFSEDDQLTAVWDSESGALRGVIVGAALGALRTGAIGGVAVKVLAPPDARQVALIGSGRQAFTQIQAVAAVRPIEEVRVYSRTPAHRYAFCEDMAELLPHVRFIPMTSAESAIRGADIIIGATNSPQPVIFAEWVREGAHISTIGPKGATRRETDAGIVHWAQTIVTDSPEQARAYPDGLILDGTDRRLDDLADLLAQSKSGEGRRASANTLFISTGLAGTEVALAAHLLGKASRQENSDL